MAHEKLLGVVNNGVLTQEELVNNESGYLMGGSIAFLALGLLLIVLGLRNGRKNAKKKNNTKQKKIKLLKTRVPTRHSKVVWKL